MNRDTVISVEKLSKKYKLGQIGATSFRESAERLWHRVRGRNPEREMAEISDGQLSFDSKDCLEGKEIWALKDVSFEVKKGEVLGVIGKNGAGKSTLLKILARITDPTSGRAVMCGRVASLLEVGTGFHPELTGRENVYLNGAILGMNKKETANRFDEIVDFSGIEGFIDTPVKRYSSGMYVRLAFAVAAHLDPDILFVDEVLAVGDISFQRKCLGKMSNVVSQGKTVLFVSHNMSAIKNLCPKTMLLKAGAAMSVDDTPSVIDQYLGDVKDRVEDAVNLRDVECREGNGFVKIVDYEMRDISGERRMSGMCGEGIVIALKYLSSLRGVHNVQVCINIYDADYNLMTILNSYCIQSLGKIELSPEGEFICSMSKMSLYEGDYFFSFWVRVDDKVSDLYRGYIPFSLSAGDFFGTGLKPYTKCLFFSDYKWNHFVL